MLKVSQIIVWLVDKWVGGWMGEWTGGWMGGWTGGWMGGWVDLRIKLTQPPIGVGAWG